MTTTTIPSDFQRCAPESRRVASPLLAQGKVGLVRNEPAMSSVACAAFLASRRHC